MLRGVVLIGDKASGTQLIQELIVDGCHTVSRYQPDGDKIMRLHAPTAMIENGHEYRSDRPAGVVANKPWPVPRMVAGGKAPS